MKARRLLWHLRRGHISSVLELQTEMKVERNFLHASFTLQNLAASKQAFCLMADASVPELIDAKRKMSDKREVTGSYGDDS